MVKALVSLMILEFLIGFLVISYMSLNPDAVTHELVTPTPIPTMTPTAQIPETSDRYWLMLDQLEDNVKKVFDDPKLRKNNQWRKEIYDTAKVVASLSNYGEMDELSQKLYTDFMIGIELNDDRPIKVGLDRIEEIRQKFGRLK